MGALSVAMPKYLLRNAEKSNPFASASGDSASTDASLRTIPMLVQPEFAFSALARIAASSTLVCFCAIASSTARDYVFPSRIDHADHLSTRQYARLVDEWVVGVGLRREEYGTHSLRRTKASTIYKATGNLRAVQILLGHTKIENTVRYLGVDVEDALTLAEGTEV